MPRLCYLLLPLFLLLTGCPGNSTPAPPPLQGLETSDADGAITSVTLLDRDSEGNLQRVRHYTGAGSDGVWRTADDELAHYAICTHARAGLLLHDPLAELNGHFWIRDRFTARTCALDEQASFIDEHTFIDKGPDAQWFTEDDTAGAITTLTRTISGHQRTVIHPPVTDAASTCCNVPNGGLNNIVYNPYLGLGAYRLDSRAEYGNGPLIRLQPSGAVLRYERSALGELQRKTVDYSAGLGPEASLNLTFPGDITLYRVEEEYETTADGARVVRQTTLLQSAVLESMAGSSTGLILLQMLGGISGPVVIDGQSYLTINIPGRVRVVTHAGQLTELVKLTNPGADGLWGSADDVVQQRQRYLY